ncbi:MAG TPA: FGGY-family carbohydrate kinase [Nakamurella sp.]|nr:FGGY-family carbohydrate kinase [Nakamurella sp.]
MTSYLVAIDNGSQSTKVSIIDGTGHIHAQAQHPLRPYEHPAAGHVVHPGDDVWESITAACEQALGRFTGDLTQLVGVGLCTIRFCRALLTADGELSQPMLSWMDERVSRPYTAEEQRTRYVTTSSGYITHRLTGNFRDAAANYQGIWPIDQATWRWSQHPEPYRETGIAPGMLFELVDPGELLGQVTKAAAAVTGLPAGLPVYATANDKAVEALGCGLRTDDTLLVSLGTYITAMTVGTSPTIIDGSDTWSNFSSIPHRYLRESNGIRRGMWTVSWYQQLVGDDIDDLNTGAADIPPGSGGLLTMLDWLAPTNHPYRRGALLGFDGRQGRYHLYRSILEGIALTMRNHSAALAGAGHRDFASVIISGGGSRSNLMMQIFADVMGRPTQRTEIPDAAGMGAAICAAIGSGVHPGWDAAINAMVRTADTFQPISDHARRYTAINRTYAELTRYTDPLFQFADSNTRSEQQ